MTDLNGNGLRPSGPKGVLLSSRQLTVRLDHIHHAMLKDLARVNNCSEHEAAEQLLTMAVQMAHLDLQRQKFVFLLCHWMTWSTATILKG